MEEGPPGREDERWDTELVPLGGFNLGQEEVGVSVGEQGEPLLTDSAGSRADDSGFSLKARHECGTSEPTS